MTNAGLCSSCVWARLVGNRRGSTFWRCARAETDHEYRKYPPLPVLACPGYEPMAPREEGGNDDPGPLRSPD